MQKLRIMSIVGARPNFIKIAPFANELARYPDTFDHHLVHTGQHYDQAMSADFFDTLGIPEPNVNLEIGSGSHAEQVGRTMIAIEPVLQDWKPDWVVVVGDVNATCAVSITAAKEGIKVAHIEAGLRSFDNTMPEEINRIITDRIADLLFTPDELADRNLLNEGRPSSAIKRVGNIMIDTLNAKRSEASKIDIATTIADKLLSQCEPPDLSDGYTVLTMHRPSNVDSEDTLKRLVALFLDEISKDLPIVWILHPRTRKKLEEFGLFQAITSSENVVVIDPVGYLEMLRLNMNATVMMTDSGGLQEESCVLGTPCITLRHNTERPITLQENGGLSVLAGNDTAKITQAFADMSKAPHKESCPPLWDGMTAKRIVEVFRDIAADITS